MGWGKAKKFAFESNFTEIEPPSVEIQHNYYYVELFLGDFCPKNRWFYVYISSIVKQPVSIVRPRKIVVFRCSTFSKKAFS